MVVVRKNLSSLTGLGTLPNREPSHKWLGYCQSEGERNRPGCTVSRLAEWNLRKMVAHRKVSGGTPNTAGGTPALPFSNMPSAKL